MPQQPIPKSIASPSLLSHILVSKYQDHLPLYRQELILQRFGVDIARNTLASWVIKTATLLKPLYNLLKININNYDVAFADETILQVLKEPNKKAQSKSYMWVFAGGPSDKFTYIYEYSASRSAQTPIEFFNTFTGHLHCDGYAGYETLAKQKNINLVGCWYHCRRKFIEVQKASNKKTGVSAQLLKIITKLAHIEKEAVDNNLDFKARYDLRQEKAALLIEKFYKIIDEKFDTAPPKSLLGKAMAYAKNQKHKLTYFLTDGRLEISNNIMERKMKPFAICRKNWLFSDSVDGAEAGAIIYSLIETCKEHDIEPYYYLMFLFKELPLLDESADLEPYLPYNIDPALLEFKPPWLQ